MVDAEPTKPEMAPRTCTRCNTTFDAPVVQPVRGFTWIQKLCQPCRRLNDMEVEAYRAEEERKKAEEAWFNICPPLYRETDPARLSVDSETLDQILKWTPNPQGIGLTGTSGAGKTRAMFLLLKSLHFGGHRIVTTTAKRFEHWCHRMFDKDDEARLNIRSARNAKILFIDDIGKEKYTERVESEFYDLIEHRTSNLLPILWTANATGQQLVKMMGEDRGTPIVRRLREFSTIISV